MKVIFSESGANRFDPGCSPGVVTGFAFESEKIICDIR